MPRTSRNDPPGEHVSELTANRLSVRLRRFDRLQAQWVADTVGANGIRALLGFAPTPVRTPRGVEVKHLDLAVSLESLSYFLASDAHEHPPSSPA